jgi:hypothetical protein
VSRVAGKVYTTEEIKQIVEPIAREYGIGRLSLFGSYARGNAKPGSDIDFHLMDCGDIRGLFRLAGFHRRLEESFGIDVDVLTTGALDDNFLSRISGEEVILYDRS